MSKKTNTSSTSNDIARLFWQCRRGMLELDILLQNFLKEGYQNLSQNEKHVFKKLLKNSDNLLLEYLMGRTVPMDKDTCLVVERIRKASCH